MFNTIRADFYRLNKTKGFWITQVLLIALVAVTIIFQAVGSVGVSGTDEVTDAAEAVTNIKWTGIISVEMLTSMSSFVMYFLIPLLVISIGYDFSKQTYKNSLTVGVSRTKFYFSKYITFSLIVLLQLFSYILVSFIVGSVLNGVGNDFGLAFLGQTSLVLVSQYLFLMAIFSLATFALFLTHSNVAAVLTAIIVPIATNILTFALPKLTFLKYFDFQGLLGLGSSSDFGQADIYPYLLTAILTIFCAIVATLIAFNKQEL